MDNENKSPILLILCQQKDEEQPAHLSSIVSSYVISTSYTAYTT